MSPPAGGDLDAALAGHAEGRLGDAELAGLLAGSEVVLAVTRARDGDTVDPFVFTVDGQDYAAAFSSIDRFRSFTAGTPFVRAPFRSLAAAWPEGLGLVLNPTSGPSVTMDWRQVRAVAGAGATEPAARTEPAGTQVRIGAPEPGLAADAVAGLRDAVAASEDVTAAYPLAWAAGDDERPRLVIGLRLVAGAAPGAVPRFAGDAASRHPLFAGLDFVELRGRLLSSAQQHVEPVV